MKEIIYNIDDYSESGHGREIILTGLTEELGANNLLGIINKTQKMLLYSPMHADRLQSVSYSNGTLTINLTTNAPRISAHDKLLVKLYSDSDSGSIDQAKDEIMGKVVPFDFGESIPACDFYGNHGINSDHELLYVNDYVFPQDFGVGSVVTAKEFDPTTDFYLANVVGADVDVHYDGQDFSITGVTNWLKVQADKCYRCTAVVELTYTADGEDNPYPDSGEEITTGYLYVYEEYDPNGKSIRDVVNTGRDSNSTLQDILSEIRGLKNCCCNGGEGDDSVTGNLQPLVRFKSVSMYGDFGVLEDWSQKPFVKAAQNRQFEPPLLLKPITEVIIKDSHGNTLVVVSPPDDEYNEIFDEEIVDLYLRYEGAPFTVFNRQTKETLLQEVRFSMAENNNYTEMSMYFMQDDFDTDSLIFEVVGVEEDLIHFKWNVANFKDAYPDVTGWKVVTSYLNETHADSYIEGDTMVSDAKLWIADLSGVVDDSWYVYIERWHAPSRRWRTIMKPGYVEPLQLGTLRKSNSGKKPVDSDSPQHVTYYEIPYPASVLLEQARTRAFKHGYFRTMYLRVGFAKGFVYSEILSDYGNGEKTGSSAMLPHYVFDNPRLIGRTQPVDVKIKCISSMGDGCDFAVRDDSMHDLHNEIVSELEIDYSNFNGICYSFGTSAQNRRFVHNSKRE